MFKYQKVGGLHFFRVLRFQVSWCICKPSKEAIHAKRAKRARKILKRWNVSPALAQDRYGVTMCERW